MQAPHTSITSRLRDWPASHLASRAPDGWASDPVLERFGSAAAAAVDARSDGTVFAALAARAGVEEPAALACMSVLADRLGTVVARWRRAGMPAGEILFAEADLVAEAFELLVTDPTSSSGTMVRTAWHRAAGRRRTELSRAARHVDLQAGSPPPVADLAELVVLSVVASATPIPTGASGAERSRRWRARRALRATLADDFGEVAS